MSPDTGQVVTFYSYKGGTGRTMALANLAVLLARGGRGPVLTIDWDLEAPGLHHFFTTKLGVSRKKASVDKPPGLIDLFQTVRSRVERGTARVSRDDRESEYLRHLDLADYVVASETPDLFMMRAGRFDETYSTRVSTFDWEGLFQLAPGVFQEFARILTSQYRYVLIDSRTGVSDSSGICTSLLPDRLAVVFTPNRQSLTGAVDVVERAARYRQHSSDTRPLLIFPLPSRVELSEDDLRRRWRYGDGTEEQPGYQPIFEDLFDRVYDLSGCQLEHYFNEIQIQHSARFSYGEEIAVLVEPGRDRLSLSRSFERFARAVDGSEAPWTFGRETVREEAESVAVADVAARRLEAEAMGHVERGAVWDQLSGLYRRDVSRVAQLSFMAVATTVCLAVVSILLLLGYSPPHSNPFGFWFVELVVIIIAVASYWDKWFQEWIQVYIGRSPPAPTPAMRAWITWRDRSSHWIVMLCVGASMTALWQLVDHTGGGLQSPFAPLLAAPALFGAFVAQSNRGVLELLAVSAATILVLDATAPKRIATNRIDVGNPRWYVYAIATIALLVIAGLISTVRIMREERLAQSADELGRIVRASVLDALVSGREEGEAADRGNPAAQASRE